MMKHFKNERGLTLVELLAVFVIGSLVLTLIVGIHISIQKQYNNQKAEIEYIYDITTTAHAITKDLRKAGKENVTVVSTQEISMKWMSDAGVEINRNYKFEDNTIKRDHGDFIRDIKEFEVTRKSTETTNPDYHVIILKIVGSSNKDKNSIETEITLR